MTVVADSMSMLPAVNWNDPSLPSPAQRSMARKRSVLAMCCEYYQHPTYHIVVCVGIECCGIRHATVHYPSLRLVLGPNKVLDLAMEVSALLIEGAQANTHASDGTCPGASLASQYLKNISHCQCISGCRLTCLPLRCPTAACSAVVRLSRSPNPRI